MATNPVVKTMRFLSNCSFDDLKMTAEKECITIPEHTSKVELIALILTARAGREARDSVYKMVREGNRKKYRLLTEDNTHYLCLTDEQAVMLEWCIDREINFYDAEMEEMNDIRWETP